MVRALELRLLGFVIDNMGWDSWAFGLLHGIERDTQPHSVLVDGGQDGKLLGLVGW